MQIHNVNYIRDLKNLQKMMNVLNIRLQLDGMPDVADLAAVMSEVNIAPYFSSIKC